MKSEPVTKGASEPEVAQEHKKRHRFGSDSINDLLFWGCHLCVVAISLAIMWVKIDGTYKILRTLLVAQNQELDLARSQALKADGSAQEARNAERQRAIQVGTAARSIESVLTQVVQIQTDVNSTLTEVRQINKAILAETAESKVAAEQAANASSRAAGASKQAAGAASAAAGASDSTRAIVARRVVTTEDKAKIVQEQQALAQKKQQLNQTIRQVKKQGPTLLQKMGFH